MWRKFNNKLKSDKIGQLNQDSNKKNENKGDQGFQKVDIEYDMNARNGGTNEDGQAQVTASQSVHDSLPYEGVYSYWFQKYKLCEMQQAYANSKLYATYRHDHDQSQQESSYFAPSINIDSPIMNQLIAIRSDIIEYFKENAQAIELFRAQDGCDSSRSTRVNNNNNNNNNNNSNGNRNGRNNIGETMHENRPNRNGNRNNYSTSTGNNGNGRNNTTNNSTNNNNRNATENGSGYGNKQGLRSTRDNTSNRNNNCNNSNNKNNNDGRFEFTLDKSGRDFHLDVGLNNYIKENMVLCHGTIHDANLRMIMVLK